MSELQNAFYPFSSSHKLVLSRLLPLVAFATSPFLGIIRITGLKINSDVSFFLFSNLRVYLSRKVGGGRGAERGGEGETLIRHMVGLKFVTDCAYCMDTQIQISKMLTPSYKL